MRYLPGTGTLVLILALATPAPQAAVDGITLDDVVALLKAEVGEPLVLRQVSAAGAAFRVGVPEILALKQAGASDGLIESLMAAQIAGTLSSGVTPAEQRGERPQPASAPADRSSFRIFTEVTEDGEEILHVTNLDAAGRRMGGQPSSQGPAPLNPYTSRQEEFEGPRPYQEDGYEADEIGRDEDGRVVVNVYPPPSQSPETLLVPVMVDGYLSPYMYRDPYAHLYPRGQLPGHYYRRTLYGHDFRPAPPGSYTHYLQYHARSARLNSGTHGLGPGRPVYLLPNPLSPAVRGFDFIGPAQARATLQRMRSGVGQPR